MHRRKFAAAGSSWFLAAAGATGSVAAQSKPLQVAVDLPQGRVPLSFIIDDSTCLVNMGKFCMPQFAATYPKRKDYQKPWQEWPDEIPDSFVRRFGSWCAEHGVKGKYSIVPNPACVGWLDRTLPGWSQPQLKNSLKLVRDLMVPNWDIHPEMITHTRVIDLKTGRPFADISPAHMENTFPQEDVSTDYLASYLAYALRILKNCDLPCEGITTPGGFGNRVKQKLPQAVFESVRDVYGSELPHYFKYISEGDESTDPKLEARSDVDPNRLVVNIPAGTGDWFGGWDGVSEIQGDRYANQDATSGRMVELIEQRRPAVMLCHWPGLYCGGSQAGFHEFQRVVVALENRFKKQTLWMKISEIGRYEVARQLTRIESSPEEIRLSAPYACEYFTLRIQGSYSKLVLHTQSGASMLKNVQTTEALTPGTFCCQSGVCHACFLLKKGESRISVS